jgi:hypothetical protein
MARMAGETDKPVALANLSPHLPEPCRIEVLRQALEAVQAIPQSRYDDIASHRGRALLRLVPRLPEALLPEALEAAREIVSLQYQADVLRCLIRQMPYSLVLKALQIVRSVRVSKYRAELLGSLALRSPDSQRIEILKEALAAGRRVPEEFGNGGGRAEVLEHLAPHLPEELISDAFAVACSIRSDQSRARAMKALAPRLAELPRPVLYSLWQDHLQRSALHERKRLLYDLQALGSVINSLGGAQAILGTINAIDEVGCWWP